MFDWITNLFSGQNLIYASSAMEGVSKILQGNQAAKYLEYQSAQALADAQAEREVGRVRAGLVRKTARTVKNEAIAAQGASGSSVDSVSAMAVREHIDRSSETDALMELYGGARRAGTLTATAAGYRAQAGLTRSSAYGSAAGSLLTGAAKAYQLRTETDKWIRRIKDPVDYGVPATSLSDPDPWDAGPLMTPFSGWRT